MADRWIVAKHSYLFHTSLAAALREANRLRAETEGEWFRVYRVKTSQLPGNTAAVCDAAQKLCEYVGYNISEINDPFLIALASRLQYELAVKYHEGQRESLETIPEEMMAHA